MTATATKTIEIETNFNICDLIDQSGSMAAVQNWIQGRANMNSATGQATREDLNASIADWNGLTADHQLMIIANAMLF